MVSKPRSPSPSSTSRARGAETIDEIPWTSDDAVEISGTGTRQQSRRLILNEPRRCRHPKGQRIPATDGGWACGACWHVATGEAVRRSRRARRRGKDGERRIARATGQRRVGQYGGIVDVGDATSPVAIQVKAGPTYWPTRVAAWLDALASAAHGRPRVVAMVETGHHGRRNRAIVALYLDELDEAVLAGLASLDLSPAIDDNPSTG